MELTDHLSTVLEKMGGMHSALCVQQRTLGASTPAWEEAQASVQQVRRAGSDLERALGATREELQTITSQLNAYTTTHEQTHLEVTYRLEQCELLLKTIPTTPPAPTPPGMTAHQERLLEDLLGRVVTLEEENSTLKDAVKELRKAPATPPCPE